MNITTIIKILSSNGIQRALLNNFIILHILLLVVIYLLLIIYVLRITLINRIGVLHAGFVSVYI